MTEAGSRRASSGDRFDDMVAVAELADRLGLREETITLLATTGDIPGAIRVGDAWQFPARSVDRWLYKRTSRTVAMPR